MISLTRARWSDLPQQRGIVIQLRTDLAVDLPEIMGSEVEIRDALTNGYLHSKPVPRAELERLLGSTGIALAARAAAR